MRRLRAHRENTRKDEPEDFHAAPIYTAPPQHDNAAKCSADDSPAIFV
jgi:hypothetical protein